MHSMTIQERLCPRCGIRRTVRLGRPRIAFCFNCRLRWGLSGATRPNVHGAGPSA
jgi:hypothetical protein